MDAVIDDQITISIKQVAEFEGGRLKRPLWRSSAMTREAVAVQPSRTNATFSVTPQIFGGRPAEQLQDVRAASFALRVNGDLR